MGRCLRGEKCRHVHAHLNDLPAKLVTHFTFLITPLVSKKIEKINSYPGNKQDKTGEEGSGVFVKFS